MGERADRPGESAKPDAVEIKLNFDSSQIKKAMDLFELDPDDGKPRRIWFGENRRGLDGRAALPLSARGVILRVREKRNSDVTLKLRGPDGCLDLSAWTKRTRGLGELAKVEGDWSGNRRLVSASLDTALDDEALDELKDPDPSVERLLSDEQLALAGERPAETLHLVQLESSAASRVPWTAIRRFAAMAVGGRLIGRRRRVAILVVAIHVVPATPFGHPILVHAAAAS